MSETRNSILIAQKWDEELIITFMSLARKIMNEYNRMNR